MLFILYSVQYRENGLNGFRVGPNVNDRCRDAFVIIPTGSLGRVATGNLGDRFCGVTLAGGSVACEYILHS